MRKGLDWFWGFVETVARQCFYLLCRIAHRKRTAEAEEGFLQFVKFSVVGLSNTAVNYIVYVISLSLIKFAGLWENYDYLAATGIGFLLSVAWSFFWNNNYVFVRKEGERRSLWGALIRTYVSYSFTSLFLNGVLMIVWVRYVGLSEFVAPILNLLATVPLNFLMNKFWAFQKEER